MPGWDGVKTKSSEARVWVCAGCLEGSTFYLPEMNEKTLYTRGPLIKWRDTYIHENPRCKREAIARARAAADEAPA